MIIKLEGMEVEYSRIGRILILNMLILREIQLLMEGGST